MQDVLGNWQEYRDEERRLSKWLLEKENQVNSLKHLDLNDPDAIKYNLQRLIVCVKLLITCMFIKGIPQECDFFGVWESPDVIFVDEGNSSKDVISVNQRRLLIMLILWVKGIPRSNRLKFRTLEKFQKIPLN